MSERITHGLGGTLGKLITAQLDSIEERHQAVVARLTAVEVMAERAARKGYDLDPHDVLAALTTPTTGEVKSAALNDGGGR